MAPTDEVLSLERQAQELEGFIREWHHLVRDLEKREAATRQEVEKATSCLADVKGRIGRMKAEYPVVMLSEFALARQHQRQFEKQLAEAHRRGQSGLRSAVYYRGRIAEAEGQLKRIRSNLGAVIPFPRRP